MSPLQSFLAAVDRIENRTVVVVTDEGNTHEVLRHNLGVRVKEGNVLRVPTDAGGAPIWKEARRDPAEERRRAGEVRKRLDDLKRGDPGGDVNL